MRKKLRIGIVGCGNIAKAHLKGYEGAGGAAIVSVYDISATAAEAMARQTGACVAASVTDMARKHSLDAVSICTPPACHYDSCKPFLKARIPIICEKPLELNATTAARFAAAVKKSRCLFMIAFCHRFHPPIIKLKELIKERVLGRPILFRNIFGGHSDMSKNHRANPALSGGGPLIDHCSHSVDLFRFMVGDPTRVQGMAANVMQKLAVEDLGMMQLDAAGKALGEITGSYSLPLGSNFVELYGTKGRAVVSYFNPGHPELAYIVDRDTGWREVDVSKLPERFAGEIGHFLSCVRSGKKPAITVDDGLKANRIVSAVYKSVAEGRRIKLKL